jgi:pilus assembly protein CpaE
MTTVVEQDPVLAELFRSTLGGETTLLSSLASVEEHLRQHPEESVVVLGPSVDDDEAADFARRNRIVRPAVGVVLVRPQVGHEVLTAALRSGMSEVVETSDATALRDAVRRADDVARAIAQSRDQAGAPIRGALVTVFSTKGGVGKSLVATNVAAALADRGSRVCLVDLDVQCGDVAIMLQLTPQRTLGDLDLIRGDVDTSGLESLLTEHSENLTVLAAPLQLGAQVPVDDVGTVLDLLTGMFDVVVVDTSGQFDDHGLQALDRSDVLVLVGTLDIPSLKSLKLATGTLDLLGVPRARWRLVLNRADAKVGLSTGEFAQTLGLAITTSLPSSRDVLVSVNRGELLVRVNRTNPVSKALAELASSLLSSAAPREPESGSTEGDERPRRGGRRRVTRTRKVA